MSEMETAFLRFAKCDRREERLDHNKVQIVSYNLRGNGYGTMRGKSGPERKETELLKSEETRVVSSWSECLIFASIVDESQKTGGCHALKTFVYPAYLSYNLIFIGRFVITLMFLGVPKAIVPGNNTAPYLQLCRAMTSIRYIFSLNPTQNSSSRKLKLKFVYQHILCSV